MPYRRKLSSQQSTVHSSRPPPPFPLPIRSLHQLLGMGADNRGSVTLHPTHPKTLKSWKLGTV